MLPCAAYLRVYEPLSAFSGAERARWEAYASAQGHLSRAEMLQAEQAESLRRVIALPPVVAPEQESDQAYIRWADGVVYVCPWQTRLRSWLALRRLRETARPPLADAFAPAQADSVAGQPARLAQPRVHILSSTWSIPQAWFVLFAPAERWLVVGSSRATRPGGSATAATARALVYSTAMAQARRRVARGIVAFRRGARAAALAAGRGVGRRAGRGGGQPGPVGGPLIRARGELEQVGRWLEEFHPHSLVELDYGGLVQLIDVTALRADQSVADMTTALGALSDGDLTLASASLRRLRTRWQAIEALEFGS
jgi:hypothetical protein